MSATHTPAPDRVVLAKEPATADTATDTSTAIRAFRAVRRWRWRNRRHLTPLYGSVALAAYGQALTSAPHGTTGAVATDAVATAAFYAWTKWRAKDGWDNRPAQFLARHRALPSPPGKPLRRDELLRSAGAVGSAVVLTTLMPALDAGPFEPGMAGVWWLGWLPSVAIPWWYRRRIRPTEEEIPEGLEARVERWLATVGSAKGALPGAELIDAVDMDVEGAWQGTIALDAVRHTTDDAIAATKRIAAAFGVSVTSISVEGDHTGNAALARLQVYQRNPLKAVPVFPGPQVLDKKTGIATIGWYIDGTPAMYQMWRPGWGAVHSHISGSTGAGKSAIFRSLFAIEKQSGLVVTWGGDPQYGKSFGFWQDYLDYFACGPDECMGMLIAANTELDRRSKNSAVSTWVDADGDTMYGETDWEPGEDPLLAVTIDEWQDVWGAYGDEAIELAVRIAILGRKCGIKLRLGTHLPTLESLGSSKLRQPLTAGNNIALRTTERSAGYVINLPADPNDIPAVWPDEIGVPTSGLGYMKGVQERAAVFRGWAPEAKEVATRWAKKADAIAELTPGAGENIGPLYTQWRDRLAARRAGEEPVVPGVNDDGEEATGTAGTATVPPVVKQRQTPVSELATMIQAEVKPASGTKKTQILAFVANQRITTTGLIADRLGIPLSTVSSTLTRAAKKGEVEALAHGTWAPVVADVA
ncbi:MarR family transcriptional regulator [Streptomyces sp. NPDC056707]|uniref:MarR family transcriptional regulator n=1 Tax=Streptomyces sp. NPDC056707 TaxID=3345919 RepID=UPI00367CF72C